MHSQFFFSFLFLSPSFSFLLLELLFSLFFSSFFKIKINKNIEKFEIIIICKLGGFGGGNNAENRKKVFFRWLWIGRRRRRRRNLIKNLMGRFGQRQSQICKFRWKRWFRRWWQKCYRTFHQKKRWICCQNSHRICRRNSCRKWCPNRHRI